MPLLFIIGAVVGVLAITVGCLYWVNTRLGVREATVIYDIEEATDFVAGQLPDAVAQKLDRDDLQALLFWHLAFLRENGMATFGGVDLGAMEAAGRGETVVAHEDEAVDYVLAQVVSSGRELDEVDVVVAVELDNRYLQAIGAFGPSKKV